MDLFERVGVSAHVDVDVQLTTRILGSVTLEDQNANHAGILQANQEMCIRESRPICDDCTRCDASAPRVERAHALDLFLSRVRVLNHAQMRIPPRFVQIAIGT